MSFRPLYIQYYLLQSHAATAEISRSCAVCFRVCNPMGGGFKAPHDWLACACSLNTKNNMSCSKIYILFVNYRIYCLCWHVFLLLFFRRRAVKHDVSIFWIFNDLMLVLTADIVHIMCCLYGEMIALQIINIHKTPVSVCLSANVQCKCKCMV